ncbi:SdpI family protein [Pseudonocardia sp. TRM90224]|uniref:SdpI family protein n=1 Tax=Pseudonocardia sp. TRM90224 TaxID=2812678 RepID=UPI001E287B29|nr:SdpI family protein [Pseudonocardia sp. TRM90224]
MPLPVQMVVGSLLVLIGAALVTVAVLGVRSVLRRNRWVGVRTRETLRSDATFAVANRAAAAPVGAAGAIAVLGGIVLLGGAGGALVWIVLVVSVLGLLVLTGVGGMVGDRAAAAVEPPTPPAACAGTCAGCELVAGCRPELVKDAAGS